MRPGSNHDVSYNHFLHSSPLCFYFKYQLNHLIIQLTHSIYIYLCLLPGIGLGDQLVINSLLTP